MRTGRTLRDIVESGFENNPIGFELPRALYIHIPLCNSRCSYCDFHSFDTAAMPHSAKESYIYSLSTRIASMGRDLFSETETVYIGGGTPSVLDAKTLDKLLAATSDVLGKKALEWTIECNPESLTLAKIEVMKNRGVTRLSLGLQSMDDEELGLLGRHGNVASNEKALILAIESGLDVSADLIAGLPSEKKGRTSSLNDSIRILAASGIGHLSLYDLTVENGTRLAAGLESGKLLAMDDDAAYEERKAAEAQLEASGFIRYEISNFARPGYESRHNSIYWDMLSYLGLGSGAVSTLISTTQSPGYRQCAALRVTETKDLSRFLSDADSGMEFESISARVSAFETIMMGLRTSKGIDSGRFRHRFGWLPQHLFPRALRKWSSHFRISDSSVGLDFRGMDILNTILVDIGMEIDATTDFLPGGAYE